MRFHPRPSVSGREVYSVTGSCGCNQARSLDFISQRSASLRPSRYDRSTDRSRLCFGLSARRATSKQGWLGIAAPGADAAAHRVSRLRDTRWNLGKLKIARVTGRACTYHLPQLAPSNQGSSQHLDIGLLNPFRPSRLALAHPFVLFPRNESFRLLSGIAHTAGCLTSSLHHLTKYDSDFQRHNAFTRFRDL